MNHLEGNGAQVLSIPEDALRGRFTHSSPLPRSLFIWVLATFPRKNSGKGQLDKQRLQCKKAQAGGCQATNDNLAEEK